MTLLDIPDNHILEKTEDKITCDFDLTIFRDDDRLRFTAGNISTSWMGPDDRFISRVQFEKLNPCFLKEHLACEIKSKNMLDEGISFLNDSKFMKAIKCFDEVIYYDPDYGEAIFYKSKALFAQKHFVKSLRHYKRSVKADSTLNDIDYHKLLLKKSSEERDSFPKIKQNIYAGDEYFAKGDYQNAVDLYTKALANPSRFKDKILYKLLNKKATALLKLKEHRLAGKCFSQSIDAFENDYAYFGLALSLYGEDKNVFKGEIAESLSRVVKINQKQLLKKALILGEVGEFEDSLKCVGEFLSVHFSIDEDYLKALNLKSDDLKALDRDSGDVEYLIERLFS